jgi:hypothetical protein
MFLFDILVKEGVEMESSIKDIYRMNQVCYLVDALKFDPTYAPAITKLMDMTQYTKSQWTRSILYWYRLVVMSRYQIASDKEKLSWSRPPLP